MSWTKRKVPTAQEVQQTVAAQRETKGVLELRLTDLQRRRHQAAVLATEGTPQSTPLAVKKCRLGNVRSLDDEIARTAAQIAKIEEDLLSLETAVVANTLSANSVRTANTMSALVNPRGAAETAGRLAQARRSVHQVADGFAAVPNDPVASSVGQLWQQETADVEEVDACLARLSLMEDLDAARSNLAHGFGAASRGQSRSTVATGSSPPNSQSQEVDEDDDDSAIDARIHALMHSGAH
jgi:hypothetical protein